MERYHLITERLDLRPITTTDADRLAVLHADARVMNLLQHGVLTRAQSDAMVAHYEAEWPALGFGSVAMRVAFAPEAQGKGYAPELGRAALAFAFEIARLDRVVAITRLDNIASQRSLEKFMAREREITTDEGRTLVLYAAFNPNSGRRNESGRTSPK